MFNMLKEINPFTQVLKHMKLLKAQRKEKGALKNLRNLKSKCSY